MPRFVFSGGGAGVSPRGLLGRYHLVVVREAILNC